jgi:aspartate-semialdehyde dehydrogenase
MKVAIIGATGIVGKTMLQVLEERNFPVSELIPAASEGSIGKSVSFRGATHPICTISEALERQPDLALFSTGKQLALEYAPLFVNKGCRVVDNSPAWRMNAGIKLIVPEINGNMLTHNDMLVANPNCSTIQMVMVLAPLNKKYRVKRVVVTTFQSVSGTGIPGIDTLLGERAGAASTSVYSQQIDLNVIPHIDAFREDGYTAEEIKMTEETVKIVADPSILVTATAVRVPVMVGHSESLNIEFCNPFHLSDIRSVLSDMPGVIVVDNPSMNGYPTPIAAEGKDEVFVGRIREDFSQPNTLNCWVVADNVRKGAATNAVQIAKLMLNNGWLPA